MQRKIYIVWHHEEDRPAIRPDEFGMCALFLSYEQAQAWIRTQEYKNEFIIRDFLLSW